MPSVPEHLEVVVVATASRRHVSADNGPYQRVVEYEALEYRR